MSTPTVNLDVLRTLHRIHKQLSDLRERRDRGPRQIHAHEVGVKKREEELAKVREELKMMRKNTDAKQLQMKTNEQKIKDLGTKLNMAASNKEYQILKDQIAADKMANSVLEDEIIEMMDQTDAFGPKIAEAENILKVTQAKLASSKKEVDDQAALILGDIDRLEGELKQTEGELPEEIRVTYQRLARGMGEDAAPRLPVVEGASRPLLLRRFPSTSRRTSAYCSPASAAPADGCSISRKMHRSITAPPPSPRTDAGGRRGGGDPRARSLRWA